MSSFDDDLAPFSMLNRVRGTCSRSPRRSDIDRVAAVVGHDFGSPVGGVVRAHAPRRLSLCRHDERSRSPAPRGCPSTPPTGAPARRRRPTSTKDWRRCTPPRKHYQTYYTTREANANMWKPPAGFHAFLRAYYHAKSADWPGNTPHPLKANTPEEFAKLPRYYVMDKDKGMAEQVASDMPTAAQIAACQWLPDRELGRLRLPSTGGQGSRAACSPIAWGRDAPSGRGTAAFRRSDDRCAGDVRLRQGRLGRVPAVGQLRGHAEDGVHEVRGHPPDRGRRPLGAAGASAPGGGAGRRVREGGQVMT